MNLIQIYDDVRKTLLGGILPTEYNNPDIKTSANFHYHDAQQIALTAAKTWRLNKWVLYHDIIEWKKDYSLVLSSPLLSLDHIELNLNGANNWYIKATCVGNQNMVSEANDDNLSITNINDKYTYTIAGNTLYLNFSPTQTVVNGIAIYYQPKWSDLTESTIDFNLEEDVDKLLNISNISGTDNDVLSSLSVEMTQNTDDTLSVALVWNVITIKLANTTPTNNTIALIQAGIRALTLTSVVFTNATCTWTDWTDITGSVITSWTDTANITIKDIPELDDTLHRYISIGAAYDYTIGHDLDNKGKKLRQELEIYKDKIKEFYWNRLMKGRTRISPLKSRYN